MTQSRTFGHWGLLGALLFCGAALLWRAWTPSQGRLKSYHVRQVDEAFGLSRLDVEGAVQEAIQLWERGAGRPLFQKREGQGMPIDVRYDHRQQAIERLRSMGARLAAGKDAYEAAKARLDADRAHLERRQQDFERDLEAFRREASSGIGEGLDDRRKALEAHQRQLEVDVRAHNSEVEALNVMGRSYNLDIAEARGVGEELGEEYRAGVYRRQGGRESITVYVVQNRPALVRLLAHELGHALGIGHVQDPDALMHPRARHERLELTPQDLEALRGLSR